MANKGNGVSFSLEWLGSEIKVISGDFGAGWVLRCCILSGSCLVPPSPYTLNNDSDDEDDNNGS